MQPGHHRPDRGAHDLGDLLVREALDVGQVDGQPEVRGQRLQSPLWYFGECDGYGDCYLDAHVVVITGIHGHKLHVNDPWPVGRSRPWETAQRERRRPGRPESAAGNTTSVFTTRKR